MLAGSQTNILPLEAVAMASVQRCHSIFQISEF